MPLEKRIKEVPLPFLGQPGVCCYCGKPLPPKKRKWCGGACATEYMHAEGYFYREVCIKQNKETFGRITCESCRARPVLDYDISDWVADHKIPLAIGGTHDRDNLWMLCPACNRRKTRRDAGRIAKVRENDKKVEQLAVRRKKHKALDDFGGE